MKILNSKIIGNSEKHIIILHGLFGMGDNWKSIALRLSNIGHTVHLIDQRNHGKSFWNDKISYELMSKDLFEYFDHFKITNAIIIGHSMGGKTAMKFALEFPIKVLKLIIVDISPKKYNSSHGEIIEGLLKINFDKVKSRLEVDNYLLNFIPEKGIRQFLMKNLYRLSENKFALRVNIKSISNKINNYYDEISSDKKFLKETIFIKGELSDYIKLDDLKDIKILFPNAKIEIVPNSGHWIHSEKKDYFIDLVSDLLKN